MKAIRVYLPLAILVLTAVMFAPGCGDKKTDASGAGGKSAEAKTEAPVTIDTALITTGQVERTVEFVGTLKASEEAEVSSTLEAPVKAVLVDLGDRVEKGTVLVRLDEEKFRIKAEMEEAGLHEALARLGVDDENKLVVDNVSYVKKAKADLDDSERNLNRNRDLYAKGYVSKAQLDDAQTRYDISKSSMATQIEFGRSLFSTVKTKRASMELARKEFRDAAVKAPFSGYVSYRYVDAGSYVKAGGNLVRLVKVDTLKLSGDIPEVHATEVKVGQVVRVKLSAAPGKEFSGKITRISPSSRPDSRSFAVEAVLPNKGAVLKPGYFAEASVLTQVDNSALLAPLESLVSYAGVTKIYVVEGGKAVERAVKPGLRVGAFVEVTGAVKPGDTVVTTGMSKLYDGKTVAVRTK